MIDALAILSLLSTGEEQDLETVRGIYQKMTAAFDPKTIGPHSWHNGYQGIAACEYYLRTGDKSVMPLINTIAEAARRYQVHGGYYHWATAANPGYGVVNATGTTCSPSCSSPSTAARRWMTRCCGTRCAFSTGSSGMATIPMATDAANRA